MQPKNFHDIAKLMATGAVEKARKASPLEITKYAPDTAAGETVWICPPVNPGGPVILLDETSLTLYSGDTVWDLTGYFYKTDGKVVLTGKRLTFAQLGQILAWANTGGWEVLEPGSIKSDGEGLRQTLYRLTVPSRLDVGWPTIVEFHKHRLKVCYEPESVFEVVGLIHTI